MSATASRFSIPPGYVNFPATPANTQTPQVGFMYGANSTVPGPGYFMPDPRSRPRWQALEVSKFYLPGSISAETNAAPAASVAHLQLILADGLTIFWETELDVPLAVVPAGGVLSAGSFIVSDDLITPMQIERIDTPQVYATAQFDQAIAIATAYIGAQQPNPGSSTIVSRPGAVTYTIADG